MRLAIVTSHPIQYYGPLFRELARRLEVEVFFAHKATPAQQAAAGFGAAFEWDVDLTSGYPHRFLANVARDPGVHRFAGCDTPEIGAHLRSGGFDALLVFGWHLKSSVQAILAAKRLGIPVMVRGDSQIETPRSLPKRLVKSLGYPLLLRVFNAALYVGRRSRAYYAHYRYPAERLFFSPHCVDTEWFASRATPQARDSVRTGLGIAPTTAVVLFAGKLLPFKRPLDVAEAIGRLRSAGQDVQMMVAGSGPLQAELEARCAALEVPLHLLGFRNQTEMPPAYAAADALMLPSDGRETWGLVCNEAIACGTPIVVCEAIGCAQDLAVEGRAGRAFPLGDIAAAAEALGQTLREPPSREALRAVSRAHGLAAAADGIMAALGALTT
ncbi:MAG: glycosyltransferase [Frankiales bacterium]|nr:glycosyltransferase [Frankiales bacterium]